MMGYAHTKSQKTTDTMLHGVECDPSKLSGTAGKYVRSQGLDPDQDIKTYDHGKFQLAIANTPATLADNTIGELWVSYTVKLRKPKYHSKEGFGISRDIFRNNGPLNVNYDTDTAGGLPGIFNGPVPLEGIHNSIGCRVTSEALGTTITFPAHYAGNLEIVLRLRSIAQTFGVTTEPEPICTPTFGGNVVAVTDIVATSNTDTAQPHSGVGYHVGCMDNDMLIYVIHVRVDIASNSNDNTLQILTNTVSPGLDDGPRLSGCALEITEYNSTFGSNS